MTVQHKTAIMPIPIVDIENSPVRSWKESLLSFCSTTFLDVKVSTLAVILHLPGVYSSNTLEISTDEFER